jgi:hypothetical protein
LELPYNRRQSGSWLHIVHNSSYLPLELLYNKRQSDMWLRINHKNM